MGKRVVHHFHPFKNGWLLGFQAMNWPVPSRDVREKEHHLQTYRLRWWNVSSQGCTWRLNGRWWGLRRFHRYTNWMSSLPGGWSSMDMLVVMVLPRRMMQTNQATSTFCGVLHLICGLASQDPLPFDALSYCRLWDYYKHYNGTIVWEEKRHPNALCLKPGTCPNRKLIIGCCRRTARHSAVARATSCGCTRTIEGNSSNAKGVGGGEGGPSWKGFHDAFAIVFVCFDVCVCAEIRQSSHSMSRSSPSTTCAPQIGHDWTIYDYIWYI